MNPKKKFIRINPQVSNISLGGDYEFLGLVGKGIYSHRLAKGDYHFGSRAWKKMFTFLIVTNLIYKYIVEKHDKNKIVIADLGCGTCNLYRILDNNNFGTISKLKYYGVDAREQILQKVYNEITPQSIDFILVAHDLTKGVPFKDNSIDIVICTEVIKYWSDSQVKKFLEDVHRVLVDDGLFILSTQGIFSNSRVNLSAYLEQMKKKGFRSAYYLEEFVNLLNQFNFEIKDIITTEGSLNNVKQIIPDKIYELYPKEILEAFYGILDAKSHSKMFILKKVSSKK